jgi:hypothetical protein
MKLEGMGPRVVDGRLCQRLIADLVFVVGMSGWLCYEKGHLRLICNCDSRTTV